MQKLLEAKKVARNTRSCQKVAEQLVGSPKEKGGGGGYSIKLCSERLRPEVQSLALICILFLA